MESWCFDSLNKGFMSSGAISTSDSIIKDKIELMSCELKHPFSYDNSVLVPSHQSAHNSYFPEMGIAEMMSTQIPNEMNRKLLGDNASVGDVVSPSLVTSNVNSGDEESSSKFSSSVMDSNSRESSLVDLKLGGIGDKPKSNSASTVNVMSSAESSTPTKRARVSSLNSQTAYCQVYGCHKDLSSAKGYHRRHKVCDVHSKTPIVVVKGVEQRFCQQCSRFHLLGEFDDSKRSCRKRLAGHNERRRKPQLGFSGRSGKSFHSYSGSNFQEFTPRSTSYIFQDRGTFHADKFGLNDWGKQIKIEDGTGYAQKPAYNCIDGQLQPKSVSLSQTIEKQCSFTDSINNTGLPSVLGKNVAQYTSETVSHSLFQTNPLGSEDLTLNAASTIEGLQGITESGCALSLLSSQSQNSLGHPPRMPGIHLSIMPNSSPYYSGNEVSEKPFGVQNRYSMGSNQPSSVFMQNDSDTARSNFGNLMHLDSNFLNIKDQLSSEDGTTIDLLQLSSQLQRMENQRQIASDKQETEGFCCLKMK